MNLDTTLNTRGLDRLIAECPQAAAAAIREANEEIAKIARSLVRVRTGYTKSTIRIEETPGEIGGEVIADGAALFLELGWHTKSGRAVGPWPFLLPAFDTIWPSVPAKLAAHLYILAQGGAG